MNEEQEQGEEDVDAVGDEGQEQEIEEDQVTKYVNHVYFVQL